MRWAAIFIACFAVIGTIAELWIGEVGLAGKFCLSTYSIIGLFSFLHDYIPKKWLP